MFGANLVGLYRDDGLAATPIQSGFKTEKTKESVHKLVKNIGLKVTMSVKTNIPRTFINLFKRHFNKNHPLRSVFNKNNMRVSYSCTRNLGAIIKSHSSEILNQGKEKEVEK